MVYGAALTLVRSGVTLAPASLRTALTDALVVSGVPHPLAVENAHSLVTAGYSAAGTVGTLENLLYHARRVQKCARLHVTKRTLTTLYHEMQSYHDAPEGLLAQAQTRLMAIAQRGESETPVRMAEIVPDWAKQFEQEYKIGEVGIKGLDTGYVNLNSFIRGLRDGHLIVVAGKSGGGKSAFAVNVMVKACLAGKQKLVEQEGQSFLIREPNTASAVMFSMEMPKEEILERMAFALSGVDSAAYWEKRMTPRDWEKMRAATAVLKGLNLSLHDQSTLTTDDIAAICRQAKFRGQCDMIVIDYIQLISPSGTSRNDNREREVAKIAEDLKRIAGEIGVPVIALSQLNDDGKVRESRTIKSTANVLVVLEKLEKGEGDEGAPSTAQATPNQDKYVPYKLHVEKCRHGRVGTVYLDFYPYLTLFKESKLDASGNPF